MPMKRLSTQCMDKLENKKTQRGGESKSLPHQKTLDFLSQFARVYHAEPVLRTELCGYVLN